MVAATWIGAFTSLIPTWRGVYGRFGLDKQIGSCSILLDENRKFINLNKVKFGIFTSSYIDITSERSAVIKVNK